jgi:hypothetical protein
MLETPIYQLNRLKFLEFSRKLEQMKKGSSNPESEAALYFQILEYGNRAVEAGMAARVSDDDLAEIVTGVDEARTRLEELGRLPRQSNPVSGDSILGPVGRL